MKMSENKFMRFATSLISAFMLIVIFSFSTVTAMASDKTPAMTAVAELSAVKAVETPEVTMFAAAPESQSEDDEQSESVVNFFMKWIKRIILMAVFVGCIILSLLIEKLLRKNYEKRNLKNEDVKK